MVIKYLDPTVLDFQEYIQHSATGRLLGIAAAPVYAHPVDQSMKMPQQTLVAGSVLVLSLLLNQEAVLL